MANAEWIATYQTAISNAKRWRGAHGEPVKISAYDEFWAVSGAQP